MQESHRSLPRVWSESPWQSLQVIVRRVSSRTQPGLSTDPSGIHRWNTDCRSVMSRPQERPVGHLGKAARGKPHPTAPGRRCKINLGFNHRKLLAARCRLQPPKVRETHVWRASPGRDLTQVAPAKHLIATINKDPSRAPERITTVIPAPRDAGGRGCFFMRIAAKECTYACKPV